MQYQISRNGQLYGPYTREDLERYVATGNVLLTDLAKSETMSNWQPVSSILGGAGDLASPFSGTPSTPGQPGFAQPGAGFEQLGMPSYPADAYGVPGVTGRLASAAYPDPPSLSWGWVLLLDVFTIGLFQAFWNIYIASWMRRVQPASTAMFYYIAVLILGLIGGGLALPTLLHPHGAAAMTGGLMRGLIGLVTFIIKLVARFGFRGSLQAQYGQGGSENIGIDVNPVLLFFFGGLYLQSKLSEIATLKQAARINGPQTR